MSPQEAIGVAMMIVAACIPIIIIGIIAFFSTRFKHKQIMAAIEKGMPLPAVGPLKRNGIPWIRSITIGIMAISLGLAFVFAGPDSASSPALFIAIILFGAGVTWIVHGLLYRKYSPSGGQIQFGDKNNNEENN